MAKTISNVIEKFEELAKHSTKQDAMLPDTDLFEPEVVDLIAKICKHNGITYDPTRPSCVLSGGRVRQPSIIAQNGVAKCCIGGLFSSLDNLEEYLIYSADSEKFHTLTIYANDEEDAEELTFVLIPQTPISSRVLRQCFAKKDWEKLATYLYNFDNIEKFVEPVTLEGTVDIFVTKANKKSYTLRVTKVVTPKAKYSSGTTYWLPNNPVLEPLVKTGVVTVKFTPPNQYLINNVEVLSMGFKKLGDFEINAVIPVASVEFRTFANNAGKPSLMLNLVDGTQVTANAQIERHHRLLGLSCPVNLKVISKTTLASGHTQVHLDIPIAHNSCKANKKLSDLLDLSGDIDKDLIPF